MSEAPRGDFLLATLDEFKTYFGITKTENDPKLLLMLESASNMFKEMTQRSFIDYYNTPKIELHDGTKDSEIFLNEFPIRNIENVEYSYNGSFTAESIYILEEYRDYFINRDKSTIFNPSNHLLYNRPFAYNAIPGTQNIRVTYTAGYKTVPPDISVAIIHLVEYYRSEEYTPRKAFEGMSIENLGFRSSDSSLPAHIRRVLEAYRVSI